MWWSVACVAFFAVAAGVEEYSCPCVASSDRSQATATHNSGDGYYQHLLCIEKSIHVDVLFNSLNPESLNLNYRVVEENKKHLLDITSSDALRECSVLLAIVDDNSSALGRSEICPGVCNDLPAITIPVGFLKPSQNQSNSTFKTCSLNLQVTYPRGSITYLGDVLRAIASRKL